MTDTPLDVTVVLPCLDELASVGATVEEALDGLRDAGLRGEVLVVDNGSTDGSADRAKAHGARVIHESVKGYGSALRCGIDAAEGRIVVMADADTTYDLSRLGELVGPVDRGEVDMTVGSRLAGADRTTMPTLHRLAGTPAISFLLRRASGGTLSLRDSQSGYRAFHADAVRKLGLRSTGMEFASEMLLRADQAGLEIREIDLGYRPRVGASKLSPIADGWRHLLLILLIAPHLLLVWPGMVLVAVGSATTAWSLADPTGLAIGSTEWQPVFFSSIALIVGALAVLAGIVIDTHSPIALHAGPPVDRASVDRLARTVLAASIVMLIGGVVIDSVLFGIWVSDAPSPERGLALAGLAQSLLVLGGVGGLFSIVYRLLARQAAYVAEARLAWQDLDVSAPEGTPQLR